MASIIKNYVINEFITMETGSSMSCISIQQIFAKYLPSELSVVRSMPHYFKSIYIDYDGDTPVIIDINNASIIEMRGHYSSELPLYDDTVNTLLNQCIVDIIDDETDCLLYSCWLDYVKYRVKNRKQNENRFYYYLKEFFRDESQYKIYEDLEEGFEDDVQKNTYKADYNFLVTWFNIRDDDFPHPFRLTRLKCLLV